MKCIAKGRLQTRNESFAEDPIYSNLSRYKYISTQRARVFLFMLETVDQDSVRKPLLMNSYHILQPLSLHIELERVVMIDLVKYQAYIFALADFRVKVDVRNQCALTEMV